MNLDSIFRITVVEFFELAYKEQVTLMRNTDFLIGMHGAGIRSVSSTYLVQPRRTLRSRIASLAIPTTVSTSTSVAEVLVLQIFGSVALFLASNQVLVPRGAWTCLSSANVYWQNWDWIQVFPSRHLRVTSPWKRYQFENNAIQSFVDEVGIIVNSISWSSFAGLQEKQSDRLMTRPEAIHRT